MKRFKVILVLILFLLGSQDGYAAEVRGLTAEVRAIVYETYGDDIEIVTSSGIAVYTNPNNAQVFYEIPVKRGGEIVGSFSVNSEGTLRKIDRTIHWVDFDKLTNIEVFLNRIQRKEGSEVKDWRYCFMRDLYSSSLIYQLANGTTGVYVLSSRTIPEGNCYSTETWAAQIEASANVEWSSDSLQFIDTQVDSVDVVIFLILLAIIILVVGWLYGRGGNEK